MKTKVHNLGDAATLLDDGEMKLVEIEDKSVVLARRDDAYYAFDAKCTHYGAPLHQGVLHDHIVMCPWHHACFDIRTGSRQEPPALDSIATYPIFIADGQVMLDLQPIEQAKVESIAPNKTFIIVGGGAAGEAAAEELRYQGFAGKLILISASEMVPVDRPNLSKQYMAGKANADWIPLRDRSWYQDQQIELQLDTRVTAVDPIAHTVRTDKNTTLHYDKLLLALGSTPLTPDNILGLDLDGIFTLRTKADADQIIDEIEEDKRVVVIGASFIGMEVAAALGQRGAEVSVVEMLEVPFEPVLGRRIGRYLQQQHEATGTQFKLNTEVAHIHGTAGRVAEVELADGTRLAADLVIIGIGVVPATDCLAGSGIKINKDDQAVMVDAYLQTSAPDVYAAGDIARYPSERVPTARIEHWRVAQQHGFVAARNMLGQSDRVSQHVPFFWTSQGSTRLRYLGFAPEWDEVVYRGDVQEGDFIAFYMLNGRLLAAAAMGRDAEMTALEFVMKHDLPLSHADMQDPDFDIVALTS